MGADGKVGAQLATMWAWALLLTLCRLAAARAPDPTAGLVVSACGTALSGWLAGARGGSPMARPLPALASFGLLGALAAPLAVTGRGVPAALPAGLVDGLAAGLVWWLFARAGRDMAGRHGRADALAAWLAGLASSGAAVWIVLAALRAAAGAPLPLGAWPAVVVGWLAAVAAGAWLLPRQGWSATAFHLMFAMLPAFAGLLGVAEAALLLPAGEARFGPGFVALVFVPVWLASGLGFYLVGLLGALLAMVVLSRGRG